MSNSRSWTHGMFVNGQRAQANTCMPRQPRRKQIYELDVYDADEVHDFLKEEIRVMELGWESGATLAIFNGRAVNILDMLKDGVNYRWCDSYTGSRDILLLHNTNKNSTIKAAFVSDGGTTYVTHQGQLVMDFNDTVPINGDWFLDDTLRAVFTSHADELVSTWCQKYENICHNDIIYLSRNRPEFTMEIVDARYHLVKPTAKKPHVVTGLQGYSFALQYGNVGSAPAKDTGPSERELMLEKELSELKEYTVQLNQNLQHMRSHVQAAGKEYAAIIEELKALL